MSILFGIRKPVGTTVTEQQLIRRARGTARFALDGTFVYSSGQVGMGFQPYYTHKRSKMEVSPVQDKVENLLTFDGRLDNYAELCSLLDFESETTADSVIVLAAFRRWGESCFSRFIGDWALALWSPKENQVYLARDHAGTRTLYYQNLAGVLQWSTSLETFWADKSTYSLDEQYTATYLGLHPIGDLTPYKGIRSVPPAHYLIVEGERITKKPHWNWSPKQRREYHSDRDYEERFLSLFTQSVERRTGCGAPILAQLSGGMDSTSIVCISDRIRQSQSPDNDLIDTVSFYDDSEPNWNERPYFSIVERGRGKTGIHIPTSFAERTFEPPEFNGSPYLLPGADSLAAEWEKKFNNHIGGHGYRVILSGIGGDEVLGGISTPLPELAEYLIAGKLGHLLQRTIAWCLADRSPLIHMLYRTIRFTGSLYRKPSRDKLSLPPWIKPRLRTICLELSRTDCSGHPRIGRSPAAISNGLSWWSIMETLPHLYPAALTRYEYRYPYLDRDLVDFLFCVPREQLVRPGRRRSLMRRALEGIVPTEVLERRRKANLVRGPLLSFQNARIQLENLLAKPLAAELGYIDPVQVRSACDLLASGKDNRWSMHFRRTIGLELWLRQHLGIHLSRTQGTKFCC
jgi:asparagine synthase (glutamine-hydrolysing)